MRKSVVMIPGTFDPPTLGHLDIITRSAALYEKLYVVVADNICKKTLFTAEERKAMLEKLLEARKNTEVVVWNGLTVDFAVKYDVGVMIRGVRALADFSYEFELAETNRQLCPDIEILFMPTDPKFFLLRSSSIKEMAAFGADISKMVPELVAKKLLEKQKT